MYIAVSRDKNVFVGRSERIEKWENGYPVFPDLNRAYIPERFFIYETGIPAGVTEYKYCYTPIDGFYENPNYTEPNRYGISDSLLRKIKDDTIAEIEEAVLNGIDTETT